MSFTIVASYCRLLRINIEIITNFQTPIYRPCKNVLYIGFRETLNLKRKQLQIGKIRGEIRSLTLTDCTDVLRRRPSVPWNNVTDLYE